MIDRALPAAIGPYRIRRFLGEGGTAIVYLAEQIRLPRRLVALKVLRSHLVSDHIMNLLGDLEGQLPGERNSLLATCDRLLALEPTEQHLYQLARRAGLVNGLDDLADAEVRRRAERLLADAVDRHGPDGVDEACREMMLRMV